MPENTCLNSINPRDVDNASLLYEKLQFRGKQSDPLHLPNLNRAARVQATYITSRDVFYSALAKQGFELSLWELTLKSDLLICTAGGTAEGSGIALHSLTGYPYIPATSLKGVARNAALDILTSSELHALFGGVEVTKPSKGSLTFLPAYVTSENVRLTTGGITPHTGRIVPLSFPAVTCGTKFKFAVIGDSSKLIEIFSAVGELGIGAKTSSGFGWCNITKLHATAITTGKIPNQVPTAQGLSQSDMDALKQQVGKIMELPEATQRELLSNSEVKRFILEWKSNKKKKERYTICIELAKKFGIPYES